MIEVIGSSGSSGGVPNTPGGSISASGGSGSGGYLRAIFPASSLSATHTITIGAGGAAPAPGGNGNQGGATRVADPIIINQNGAFGTISGSTSTSFVIATGGSGGGTNPTGDPWIFQTGNFGADLAGWNTSPSWFTATGQVQGFFGSAGAGAEGVRGPPGTSALAGNAGSPGMIIITEFLGGA